MSIVSVVDKHRQSQQMVVLMKTSHDDDLSSRDPRKKEKSKFRLDGVVVAVDILVVINTTFCVFFLHIYE